MKQMTEGITTNGEHRRNGSWLSKLQHNYKLYNLLKINSD